VIYTYFRVSGQSVLRYNPILPCPSHIELLPVSAPVTISSSPTSFLLATIGFFLTATYIHIHIYSNTYIPVKYVCIYLYFYIHVYIFMYIYSARVVWLGLGFLLPTIGFFLTATYIHIHIYSNTCIFLCIYEFIYLYFYILVYIYMYIYSARVIW
jgi:hypothetical protein